MAYQVPPVPVPPNPVFIDKAIGEIQTLLGGISWLTHAFGRSYVKVEDRSGTESRVPMVYKGLAEYLPVEFNDNLQAQSFFEVGDQEIEGDYDAFILNTYNIDLSIVFWASLKKIDSVKGDSYYFAEDLKKDVREVLRDADKYLLTSRVEVESIQDNFDDIFANYTFEEKSKQYMSYPYVAFKFNLNLVTWEEC
jgi:hypothetical protein